MIAKAAVLNIKQFNGYFGCPTCLHPTNVLETIKHTLLTVHILCVH